MTAPLRPDPGPHSGVPATSAGAAASPIMAQYFEIKEAHPGSLLFFRMGDFFELFFDDAVTAAGALDIALTKRGRHDGADIPMCGVPVHTAETYLARLIRAGFKVAICEQVEDPAEAKKRGAKGPVRRAVVRIVTAGTLDRGRAARRAPAQLPRRACRGRRARSASPGSICRPAPLRSMPTSEPALPGDLARLAPGEILLPERLLARPALYELLGDWKPALTPLPNARFDSETARRRLERFYGVGALDGFGDLQPRRDRGRRRARRLCRPDPAGRRTLSRTAATGEPGFGHGDRRRRPGAISS